MNNNINQLKKSIMWKKVYLFWSRKKQGEIRVKANTILEAREIARKMYDDAKFEMIERQVIG